MNRRENVKLSIMKKTKENLLKNVEVASFKQKLIRFFNGFQQNAPVITVA